MTSAIAERITSQLEKLGISARAASLRVGKNPDLIRDIITGKSGNPRATTLSKLASILGVTEQWLLTGEDAPGSTFRDEVRPAGIDPRQLGSRDLPVFGTAAGSLASNGAFQLTTGPVDWVRRPPALANVRDAYALYVEGTSMSPKYEPGDLIFVHPGRPARLGDPIVLQVQDNEHAPSRTYIKILSKRTGETVSCNQFNPVATIDFKANTVALIHRVLSTNELWGL